MTDIPAKIDKICLRLQNLLNEWEEGVPVISEASATTLISQLNLFNKVIRECKKPIEFALHDLPYLLIHTVSQLWDKHENISKLVRLGLFTALQSMYNHLSSFLLSAKMAPSTENRFPEFLSLLSTLVLIDISFSSPRLKNQVIRNLQPVGIPL